MYNQDEIEEVSNEDVTNLDDVETIIYTPNIDDEELECSDEVYNSLDYFDLECPSQTVDIYKSKYVVVATNPETETGQIKLLNLDKLGQVDFEFCSFHSDVSYNRIRTNDVINCVSDTTFDVFNEKTEKVFSKSFDSVDYGLFSTANYSIFSHDKGKVSFFTDKISETFSVHTNSINSLVVYNLLLYSASSDKSCKIMDLRSKDVIYNKLENAEINSIDTNKDNLFAFGDDFGAVKVVDIRMPKNEIGIFWHKSNISMLKWKDSDVFLSTSDEQLCIFDTSLEDDWEYEKYLLFVHQGQRQYKDVAFIDNLVITTSVEGLCFFSPISLTE